MPKLSCKNWFYWLNIVVPILLGGCYYAVQRPGSLPARLLGITTPSTLALPAFLNGHLCDVLWAYAFCIALCAVLQNAWAALAVAGFVETLLEILQLLPGLAGRFRFDALDILFELIASFAACVAMIYYRRYKHEKN